MDEFVKRYAGLEPLLAQATEASSYLWSKGWAERNGGNLSVDVTEIIRSAGVRPPDGPLQNCAEAYPELAGRSFLVTGTGRRFRDLAKAAAPNVCILSMTAAGDGYRIIWGGDSGGPFRPTSEFPSHLRVHEFLRESAAPQRVVLHTHPTELIALTHLAEYRSEAGLNRALWASHPEVKVVLPKGIAWTDYLVPGSEKLALATVAGFRRGRAVVMWPMHGCVAVGREIMEAFDLIDTLNKAAQIVLFVRAAGQQLEGLTPDNLAELAQTFKLEE